MTPAVVNGADESGRLNLRTVPAPGSRQEPDNWKKKK